MPLINGPLTDRVPEPVNGLHILRPLFFVARYSRFVFFLSFFFVSFLLLPFTAQAAIETLRPTANTDTASTTNPTFAYDTDTASTSSSSRNGNNKTFDCHTWQTKIQSYTALTLYVVYDATASTDDTYTIQYSTNGGAAWTDLVSATVAAATNATASVALSTSQDLTQLQARVLVIKIGGPDNATIDINDIRTEGTYTATPRQRMYFLDD